jgi:hypothetical protein
MNVQKGQFAKQVAGAIEAMPPAATTLFQTIKDTAESARQVREAVARSLEQASAATRELASVLSAAEALAASGQEIGRRLADIASTARATLPRRREAEDRVDVADKITEVVRVVGVIAAAAEQQAAGTRAMAASVQTALAGATAAAEAMRDVLVIAETTDANSAAASRAAETFGDLAETLWSEASDLLSASAGDPTKARAFERLSVTGFQASLSIGGAAPATAEILNISRSGIALAYDCRHLLGATAEISLPTGGSVGARVVRAGHGVTGFVFIEDNLAAAEVEVERMLHLMILSGVTEHGQSAA